MEQNNSKDFIIEFENMNLNDFTFNGNNSDSKESQKDFSFNCCNNQSDNLKEFTLKDYANELGIKFEDYNQNIPSSKFVNIIDSKTDLFVKESSKKRGFSKMPNQEKENEEKIVKKLKTDNLLVKKF